MGGLRSCASVVFVRNSRLLYALAAGAALVPALGTAGEALVPPTARFRVTAPERVTAGETFEVSVAAEDDVARDLPVRVTWIDATNLTPDGDRLDLRDAVDPAAVRPRLVGMVTAGSTAGPGRLVGEGRYHVCRGEACVLHVATVRVEVRVEAPPESRGR